MCLGTLMLSCGPAGSSAGGTVSGGGSVGGGVVVGQGGGGTVVVVVVVVPGSVVVVVVVVVVAPGSVVVVVVVVTGTHGRGSIVTGGVVGGDGGRRSGGATVVVVVVVSGTVVVVVVGTSVLVGSGWRARRDGAVEQTQGATTSSATNTALAVDEKRKCVDIRTVAAETRFTDRPAAPQVIGQVASGVDDGSREITIVGDRAWSTAVVWARRPIGAQSPRDLPASVPPV